MRNRKIGFVFQFPSLLPTLTVYENVILPPSLGRTEAGRMRPSGPKPCCARLACPKS